jgi:hypothetical protein
MEEEGDGYTLGLLVELRKLCTKIAEENHGYTSEVHRLLQQLANPNLHGLDRDLSFRVIRNRQRATTGRRCAPYRPMPEEPLDAAVSGRSCGAP